MQKTGIVIKAQKAIRKDYQILTVKLDNTEESELCSIKATDPRTACGCGCTGGCAGCGASSEETGLFVVTGNIICALNTTGAPIPLGKKITVEIPAAKALAQAAVAIGLPILLSALCYTLLFMKTQSENSALSGLFIGLGAGVILAFCINRIAKERALPQVVDFCAS